MWLDWHDVCNLKMLYAYLMTYLLYHLKDKDLHTSDFLVIETKHIYLYTLFTSKMHSVILHCYSISRNVYSTAYVDLRIYLY